MRRMIFAALVMPSLALAACGEMDSTPVPLTDKQAQQLNKQLEGKVAGAPQRCISDSNADHMIRVSDDILLYRVSGKLVYRNNLRSTCPGLARDSDIIVTEQFGSQKCRGDLLRLVDRTSGIPGSVCSLGEFIPYRKDGGAG